MPSGTLDANVAIGLSKGEVFDCLAALYSPLYVPPSVAQEIIQQGRGRPGMTELAQALGRWITEAVPDPALVQRFAVLPSAADRELSFGGWRLYRIRGTLGPRCYSRTATT